MQRIIFCVLCLLVLCRLGYAQTAVSGRVVDAVTSEPLEAVSVRLIQAQAGTITEPDGSFSLSSAQSADSLVVSYIGYTPQKLPLASNGMLVQLRPAASQLNQVVVSASREAQARTEVPVAISVLSRQTLLDTKPVTLDQVLNKVSGVYMVNLGN